MQLGGLAEQALDAFGILDAGKLDQDTVGALALDGRLAHAGLVDPAADDLDGLLHRRAAALAQGLLGEGQHQPVAVAGQRGALLEIADQPARLAEISFLADGDADAVALDAEPGIANPRLAQYAAHRIHQGVQPLADHHLNRDLEQDMGSALQVEPQADLLVGQPAGDGFGGLALQQVGRRQGEPERADDENQDDLPLGKIDHRCSLDRG